MAQNNYVSNAETDNVSRKMLAWLNTYPEKPVSLIEFEYLETDKPSMALSIIQGAYKTKQYISGGYVAQYQFKVIYRVQPGRSNNARLNADELLNAMGDWMSSRSNYPDIGYRILRIVCDSRSSLFAAYENGDEDHQILMTMTYEVI